MQLRDQLGQPALCDRLGHADLQLARQAFGIDNVAVHHLGKLLEFLGIMQQALTPLRKRHAPALAVEQGALKSVFQVADAGGDGGLRQV